MQTGNQEDCVLCCREITIYATGVCDHPVCYECSARMRVLCETNECPICRSDMPLVVFTNMPCTFSDVSKKFHLFNRKFNINFEDEKIKKAFELLLINSCPVCEEIFPTFDTLKVHVRRIHSLNYCELCTDNLKIFTFERKCYNRSELAHHKIKGDPDLTSHRGHPLCEFCDTRYVDLDDLYRHLRREHYFCHFCDADGLHQYYNDYNYLKTHFRKDHYLCEESTCADEKFTSVFRTEIDLKAHKATQHIKNKSKAEAKQARTLEFEFNYVPHTRPTGSSSPRGRRYVQHRRNIEEQSIHERNYQRNQPEVEPLNTQSTQDFPYLSDGFTSNSTAAKPSTESTLSLQSFGRTPVFPSRPSNMTSAEDFPALCSSSSATTSNNSTNQNRKMDFSVCKQNMSNGLTQLPRKNDLTRTSENFKRDNKPNSRTNQQAIPKWISKKDNPNFEEDFPKLETKKTPLAAASTFEIKTSSTQNLNAAIHSQHKSAPDYQQNDEDQFVIIKSKSKKKKQKPPIDEEEEEEDKNFNQSKLSDSVSSLSNYGNLSNQENKDPYVSKPRMIVKPPKESDTWETKVSFGRDDFPPLEVMKKPPPGISMKKPYAPPPGFTSNTNVNSNSSSLSMSSIAKIVENSLKNNLNSEKDSLSPSRNNYIYQEPPDCKFRNEKLIQTINDVCRTPGNFEKFKSVSRNFRCNTISASDYYSKCLEILGEVGFQDIFPELVSLLPDIPKQQELLAVHNKYLDNNNSTKVKRKNNFKKNESSVISCKSCNQVLLVDDYKSHHCIS